MLGGNTFTAVRRSTKTNTTIRITLSASNAAVRATLVGTWAMLTVRAAALNNSTDHTGTCSAGVGRSEST